MFVSLNFCLMNTEFTDRNKYTSFGTLWRAWNKNLQLFGPTSKLLLHLQNNQHIYKKNFKCVLDGWL